MHALLGILSILLVMLPLPALPACGDTPDPVAYRFASTSSIKLLPNGLLMAMYDDPSTARPTHVTLHRTHAILSPQADSLFTPVSTLVTLYSSDWTAGSVTYVVNTHPLFYGTALADDGMPTRLWQDVHEDGLNGNEVYFTKCSTQDCSSRPSK